MNIRPDDIVQVESNEPAPFRVAWNSREYVLQPGKRTFIPAACAFNWFGDPRASTNYQSIKDADGTVGFVPDRATEIRRLRIKHGAGILGDESNFDGVAIPDVDVWTAEGEEVFTVLKDPTGKNVIPAVKSAQEDEQLRELVASQQRQIELMKQRLDMGDEDTRSAADESQLPADEDESRGVVDLRS